MTVAQTKYALTHEDGSVTVLSCVDKYGTAGLDQFIAHVQTTNKVTKVDKIAEEDVPTDRSYRNAWTFDGGNFGHDMPKARNLHRDMIRAAREPALTALDVEFMRTIERGADTAPIAAEKQKLRDAPADPRIDAAKNINELRHVWPEGLARGAH